MDQTRFFQMLAEETRLRALLLIAAEGELCVCELVHALEESQPKVSRHMAALRDVGLVTSRRHAQWVFYRLGERLLPWQRQIVEAAIASAADDRQAHNDRVRLASMKNRPDRCAAG